eukprot:NODE_24070_length_639_cov_3.263672.p3 GENE.NODE_24070_length_639_cov_3.263672~~NODE_24070_length_639_cov_3.263672.p3  ORF type:complete len:72 (-),score=0.95 NODE_24070_length_639_cov_3.263672:321-536(-)
MVLAVVNRNVKQWGSWRILGSQSEGMLKATLAGLTLSDLQESLARPALRFLRPQHLGWDESCSCCWFARRR